MKKYLLIIISLSSITFNFCSKSTADITIEVFAEVLNDSDEVYISGNDEQLGNWQPGIAKLEKIGEGMWRETFTFQKGKKLEFKITRGSWDTEIINPDGTSPPNFTIEILNDTIIKIKVALWADQIERKIEGQITGNVEYHRKLQGKGIKSRDIIVWLPPGYETDTGKNYPVLYMHDGQNIIDPKTSLFQVDWQLDENADTLINKSFIEPVIIVGIYNTPDRNFEYDESTLGKFYMNFIIDSLKPFIDRNYRTKSDRENTANGGASLGGLISFILVWEHPDVFSKAICFSPAFKIDNYNFVDNVVSYVGKKKEIKIYINNGDNELDSELQPGVDEMIDALTSQGYVEEKDFYFFKAKKSLHGEKDWAKNIWPALIYFFGTEKGRTLL